MDINKNLVQEVKKITGHELNSEEVGQVLDAVISDKEEALKPLYGEGVVGFEFNNEPD